MSTPSPTTELSNVSIRPMQEADLVEARRIFRMAFGTFLGAPDPETFAADREYIFTRWRAHPEAALVAEVKGTVAGSNFATNWGSFGFFGPLTVRPDLWNQHIAQKLLGPTLDLFEKWGVREAGLYTFAHSPKHIGLYQKFGFWPRFLTALMSKDVSRARGVVNQIFDAEGGRISPGSSRLPRVDRFHLRRAGCDLGNPIGAGSEFGRDGPAMGRRLARGIRSLPWWRGYRSRKKQLLHQICRRPARAGRGE